MASSWLLLEGGQGGNVQGWVSVVSQDTLGVQSYRYAIVIGLLIFIIFTNFNYDSYITPTPKLQTHSISLAQQLQIMIPGPQSFLQQMPSFLSITLPIHQIPTKFQNPCCLESEKLILMLEVLAPQIQLRTFVFQQQETQQSLIVDCQLDLTPNFINLNCLLARHCTLQEHRVSIYDPNSNSFASFSKIGAQSGFVHKQYLEPTIILIRYKKRQGNMHDEGIDSSSSMDQESSGERRQGRSKERTIAETIEVVKRWRDLHLHMLNSKRRKMNLQEAAKIVGVSKKSLDDYYCQLRLGEFYGFDFAANLYEGIGVLRAYVKENREKPSQRVRNRRQNQKYPKNLRVIDQFEVTTKTLLIEDEPEGELQEGRQQSMMELPPMCRLPSQQEQRLPEQPFQYEQDSLQLFRELSHLEQDFFQGFQLDLAGPRDPYRQIAYDFTRKGCDLFEQGNSFLYLDN